MDSWGADPVETDPIEDQSGPTPPVGLETNGLACRLRSFRLRRYIFARFHRNPVVCWIANQSWKNYSAWMNHDFNLLRNGEAWIANQLARESRFGPHPVLFDVGANNGGWTVLTAQHNPQARVHAFEIARETYKSLDKNVTELGNVTTNRMGLFSRDGEIEIYLNRSRETTGAFLHPGEETSKKLSARVMRGDTYMVEKGIKRVNFLKIDVECAEAEVLASFSEVISAGAIDVVQFEYGIFNIAARKLLKDYYTLLKDFRIGRLFPNFIEFCDYATHMEDFAPANYVAVRRDLNGLIERLSHSSKP